MLCDLSRQDWLEALQLPPEWAPQALWLRGSRNLSGQAAEHRRHFDELAPVTVPNGLFEDLLVGKMGGVAVAYASVYGAAMACDLVHLAGVLGARLVLLTGCCGILHPDFAIGDLLVATEAECGEGTSQLYLPGTARVKARMYGRDMGRLGVPGRLHFGPIHTTGGLLAESREALTGWTERGLWGVDLETATVYAVAEKHNMDRVSLLYGFDRPLGEQHMLSDDMELRLQRAQGNVYMTGLARWILRDYLKAACELPAD